jgi:hypothetical protein
LREPLGIRAGDILDFREKRGRRAAARRIIGDPVARVFGILKTGVSTGAIMRMLRRPFRASSRRGR